MNIVERQLAAEVLRDPQTDRERAVADLLREAREELLSVIWEADCGEAMDNRLTEAASGIS